MKRGARLGVFLFLATQIAACAKFQSDQTYTTAPKYITDELLAAGLTKTDVSELLSLNPQARMRVLTPDTYEFKGLTQTQILEINPDAVVEPNRFRKIQFRPISKKDLHDSAFSDNMVSDFSNDDCTEDTLLRVPDINILGSGEDPQILITGESFKLSYTQTSNHKGLTSWYVVPPQGSKINVQFDDQPEKTIKPDMPGVYSVALFFKRNGRCNSKMIRVTVTSNEVYKPELSYQDHFILSQLEGLKFQQITESNSNRVQALTQEGEEKVLAVLDSGVNYNHPALKRNMWVNKKEIPGDKIDNDGNGYVDDVVGYDFENDDAHPMDDVGHGTHVAGLAAGDFIGSGGNGKVKIMAVKVGSTNGLDLGSIVQGIYYAVENHADIINMSFGGHEPSFIISRSLKKAADKGILVVAASGNGDHNGKGLNLDQSPFYPASYELTNILTVGASERNGSMTSYSNYSQNLVDIAAPGGYSNRGDKISNLLFSSYLPNPSGLALSPNAGTSMAAPITAGVAAMVLSQKPDMKPEEVIETLMRTGTRSSLLDGKVFSESIVNAENALNHIMF